MSSKTEEALERMEVHFGGIAAALAELNLNLSKTLAAIEKQNEIKQKIRVEKVKKKNESFDSYLTGRLASLNLPTEVVFDNMPFDQAYDQYWEHAQFLKLTPLAANAFSRMVHGLGYVTEATFKNGEKHLVFKRKIVD